MGGVVKPLQPPLNPSLSLNLPISFKYSPSLSNTVNPGYVLVFPAACITAVVPNATIARKINILRIEVRFQKDVDTYLNLNLSTSTSSLGSRNFASLLYRHNGHVVVVLSPSARTFPLSLGQQTTTVLYTVRHLIKSIIHRKLNLKHVMTEGKPETTFSSFL